MISRSIVTTTLALCLAACGSDHTPTPPALIPIVDQAHEPGPLSAVAGVGNPGAWAQTFTADTTGTLYFVDLILSAQGPEDTIRVDLRATTAGSPNLDDATVLGSRLVAAIDLQAYPANAFVRTDFSSQGIAITAGNTYAIVLMRTFGTGPEDVLWTGENDPGEEYAGGASFQRLGGSGTAWNLLGSEFYFRTLMLP